MNDLLPFQKRPGICIDIETLATTHDAVIVSIGAVKFDFNGSKIIDEFYVNIDPKECKKLGCHIDQSTVDWWLQQPKEVRAAWQKDPLSPTEALDKLTEWWDKKCMFYCQGLSFDSPIVSNLYHKLGKKEPWFYRDEMDMRTIFNMIGHENYKAREGQEGYHNALEDARAQTLALLKYFGY